MQNKTVVLRGNPQKKIFKTFPPQDTWLQSTAPPHPGQNSAAPTPEDKFWNSPNLWHVFVSVSFYLRTCGFAGMASWAVWLPVLQFPIIALAICIPAGHACQMPHSQKVPMSDVHAYLLYYTLLGCGCMLLLSCWNRCIFLLPGATVSLLMRSLPGKRVWNATVVGKELHEG